MRLGRRGLSRVQIFVADGIVAGRDARKQRDHCQEQSNRSRNASPPAAVEAAPLGADVIHDSPDAEKRPHDIQGCVGMKHSFNYNADQVFGMQISRVGSSRAVDIADADAKGVSSRFRFPA